MNYRVITGENVSSDLLHKVFALDELVYSQIDDGFIGIEENLFNRFYKNKRTFVCLMDREELVGYINFFPVTNQLYDQIVGPVKLVRNEGVKKEDVSRLRRQSKSPEEYLSLFHYEPYSTDEAIIEHYNKIRGMNETDINRVMEYYNVCRDDDILPDEIPAEYVRFQMSDTECNDPTNEKANNLFIISIVINPKFRGRDTSRQLTDAFIEYLNKLDAEGTPVRSISAVCVSPEGEKFVRGLNFYRHRELPSPNPGAFRERVYLCYGDNLKRLKEGRLYHKTHKDDIYLFIPFADNTDNEKLNDLLCLNIGKEKKKEALKEARKNYFYPGGRAAIPQKTLYLLNRLSSSLKYEYEGLDNHELERIYLGRCRFRHTTDRYQNETMGEENADLLLLSYHSANMYVLVIYIPNCRYSSSMVGDQLSQMELDVRFDENDADKFGFAYYITINEYLLDKYGLTRCGRGKAFYCMSDLPNDNQEFLNILTGETYFSVYQDFYIKACPELLELTQNDCAIYNYYKAFISDVSLAMILADESYEDDGDDKLRDSNNHALSGNNTGDNTDNGYTKLDIVATYVFIVELVLLQNTALMKLRRKVGLALEHEGDVSYDYINQIYRDYGRTLKLWDSKNFKYYGTCLEAEQIRKAFGNDELRERYQEEQEFLERIVEVNSANDERRNGWILGIIGMLLALVQLKDYIVSIIALFYTGIGNLTRHPESIITDEGTFDNVFNVIVWGGILLFAIICICNRNRKRYERRRNLRSGKRRDDE